MHAEETVHFSPSADLISTIINFLLFPLHFLIICTDLDLISLLPFFPFSSNQCSAMGGTKLLFGVFLSVLVWSAIGLRTPQLSQSQQCRFQRLSSSQPSQRFEWEGGHFDLWNQNEKQFQCAGVAPVRFTIRPNSVHLPSYHNTPKLAYVVEGKGLLGIHLPGCAETFSSNPQGQKGQQGQQQQQPWEQGQGQGQFQGQQADQNQKVRYIREGDVIAIPAGAAHWWANHDNQQNLVIVAVHDLNTVFNQLDNNLRVFYTAGGQQQFGQGKGQQQQQQQQQPGQQWQGQQQPKFGNILRAFDSELLSEVFNVPVDTIRNIQREDERGFIVRVEGLSRVIRPTKEEEQQQWGSQGQQQQQGQQGQQANGVEENYCTIKLHTNVDRFGEADVYTKQAGRLTVVDRQKLPFLRYLDLSLEKGLLQPNALISPHWTKTGHSIVYVVRGDAQVETVNYNGQAILNDRVNQGDIFVVPQFFVSTFRAGQNGFEWVAIKTTSNPKLNPVSGYTSAFRALPLDIVTHSYQISPVDAQQLKLNSGGHSVLLPSSQSRQGPNQ